jgi:uncharacterized Zn finger protein
VFIETAVLAPSGWATIEAVMASSAVFTAWLLADEMPEEIEEAFVDSSTSLFPESAAELRPVYQAITSGAAALTLGEAPEKTD